MKRSFVLLAVCALLPLFVIAQETSTGTVQVTHKATLTAASSAAATTQPADQGYNGGSNNPVDPSTAGASGSSSGAFSLSKGALAAIITVVVIVAVGGSKFEHIWSSSEAQRLNLAQLPPLPSSTLPKSVNGTSVNPSAALPAVLQVAPTYLKPTAKHVALVSAWHRLHHQLRICFEI